MKIKYLTNKFFDTQDKETKFDNLIEKDTGAIKQRRIDILCLKTAIARFLSSGLKDDAFDVYFCFSEIYSLFGKGYECNTKGLLNILGDHEVKAGSFKDSFRDHYSHSVYVFSLGLAIYNLNNNFSTAFKNSLKLSSTKTADDEFLYRWGMVSLFHDIGYPFEIAFESIAAYSKAVLPDLVYKDDIGRNIFVPRVTFEDIDKFIDFSTEEKKVLSVLKFDNRYKKNAHTLLAYKISQMMGLSYNAVFNELSNRVKNSKAFTDHGYFSGIIMLKKLLEGDKLTEDYLDTYLDTCAAIMLHTGFWFRSLSMLKNKDSQQKLGLDTPLVFLINLCDELQIFDRIGYGAKSKKEPLPLRCYLDDKNGLEVAYAFSVDSLEFDKENGNKEGTFITKKLFGGTEITEKDGERKEKVVKGVKCQIERLDLSDFGAITIYPEIRKKYPLEVHHTSTCFYKSILCLARNIHKKYSNSDTYNKLEASWNALTLEQKMWNISPAKSYAGKLNKIGYFYDDRDLLLEKVEELTEEQIEELAILEHDRWEQERRDTGWVYEDYDANNETLRKSKRLERKHNCLVPYNDLSENDKDKDRNVIRYIIPNLISEGFCVYNTSQKRTQKPVKHIGIKGHSSLTRIDENKIEAEIKRILQKHASNKDYDTVIMTGCAEGFDTLATSVAMDLGLKIKVVIPFGLSNPLESNRPVMKKLKGYSNKTVIQLPQLTTVLEGVEESEIKFMDFTKYIAANSDHIIFGYNQQAKHGVHGTKYTKELSEKYGKARDIIKLENFMQN